MRANKGRRFVFLSPLLFLFANLCSTSTLRAGDLKSVWRDREIKIDGQLEDWQGELDFPSQQAIGVGLENDDDFLYLCLTSTDRSILRKAMANGLTVWFEPEGGKNKFGIRFPVGRPRGETGGMRERGSPPDSEERGAWMLESMREVEILGPGKKDTLRGSNFESQGIAVKIGQSPDRFVYELKVPLDKTGENLHALPFKVKKGVNIHFETGKVDLEALQNRRREDGLGPMRGGGGWGEGGGRGGGMIPGGGFGGRGRMGEMMEPFEWSAKIRLATEAASNKEGK